MQFIDFDYVSKLISKFLIMMECFFIEENQNPNACRNRHIGNVENSIEEFEMVSSPNW